MGEKLKVKIEMNHGKSIQDLEASTSCPKYNFGQVEISSMCTKCPYYHGIQRSIGVGKTKERASDWYDENAVVCAFPLQRRINRVQKIIKG